MSSLSKESLELIADWAEILTVVLALASAFCGIVLVVANKPLRKLEAAEAQEALLKQTARADIADGKLAGLERDAADAKTKAATAEAELLKLQQRTAPRRISGDQKANFLKSFDLKGPHSAHMTIGSMAGVPDADDFASDLVGLMKSAGYRDTVNDGSSMKVDMPKGIQVIFGVNRTPEAKAIAHAIRTALIQIPPLDAVPTPNPDQLYIFVGMKIPE